MDAEHEGPPITTDAFMCPKCINVYPSLIEIQTHECIPVSLENQQRGATISGHIIKAISSGSGIGSSRALDTENYVTAEVVELESRAGNIITAANSYATVDKQAVDYIIQGVEDLEKHERRDDREEYDTAEEEEEKQRRKRKTYNNDYLLNKLIRDPYFKLDRNSYTFKDTLGDWDERSTKLLIILVGKFPKCHFLLQYYFERRLSHWESIHLCMINAGYNFTVLQLRMRWREIYAKYRWTLNHNDLNEDKKTFEYMKEMDDLFGIWPPDATVTLISLVEESHSENPASKHKRLGYMGWERIATALQSRGYSYGTLQVEARWHMLVTTYKSVLDHNMMPTVEPIKAAYSERLTHLINYEPRRRKDYEKYKGKKVKLEKFPEIAMKHLIRIYKNNIPRFFDSKTKSAAIWEDIKTSLDETGFFYTVTKIKEIFFATLKLYERCLQHNAIPGAIKREGPHYKELSEIHNCYGFWPHVKRRKRTEDEKTFKKFSSRLRDSMQTWFTEESRALLKVYPTVLENFVGQTATSQQPNDLWAQVAQAYEKLGFSKRDIPEIATHIGLLRQGYAQANNFPFNVEMQKLMEVEEALCYSPVVSKFTGDTEIVYWSHDAVFILLDLYLKVQPILPYSSLSKEVFLRLVKEMRKFGYNYAYEDVREEIRSLLYQFTMRRYKADKSEIFGKRKGISIYQDKMAEVMALREQLAVGFTNGLKPMSNDMADLVFKIAREKCEMLFATGLSPQEQRDRMKLVVLAVRREVRKLTKRKPPAARKVCVHLLTALSGFSENASPSVDIIGLYKCLGDLDFERILSDIMRDAHNGSFKLPRDVLQLDKKCVTVESLDEFFDSDAPECILSVGEIKNEPFQVYDDLENMFLSVDEDVCSLDLAKKEDESLLGTSLSTNSLLGPASIVIDQEGDFEFNPEQGDQNSGKKLIYIDSSCRTKTTVVPTEDETCINVDDLDYKMEPLVQLEEFVIDHPLDKFSNAEKEETESSENTSRELFLDLLQKEIRRTRRDEKKVVDLIVQQRQEHSSLLQELVTTLEQIVEKSQYTPIKDEFDSISEVNLVIDASSLDLT